MKRKEVCCLDRGGGYHPPHEISVPEPSPPPSPSQSVPHLHLQLHPGPHPHQPNLIRRPCTPTDISIAIAPPVALLRFFLSNSVG